MKIKLGNMSKLYSLISESNLKYQCSRYQELTESGLTDRTNLPVLQIRRGKRDN